MYHSPLLGSTLMDGIHLECYELKNWAPQNKMQGGFALFHYTLKAWSYLKHKDLLQYFSKFAIKLAKICL